MAQFVWLNAIAGLLGALASGCTAGEARHAAPRPDIGIVRTTAQTCTATRIAPFEVLTAATCLGGATAQDLTFEPLGEGTVSHARWLVRGTDPESGQGDDWAIVILNDAVAAPDIGARYLGTEPPEPPETSTLLWWAAAASTEDRVDTGLCQVTGMSSVSDRFSLRFVHHDCQLGATRPGVLLYRLDGDTPQAVAFQGRGKKAIPIESFSDAPAPGVDLFATAETFIGANVRRLYALNSAGRLSQRLGIEGDWLPWSAPSPEASDMIRLDGAAEARDFAGDALTHLWAVDRAGQLHSFELEPPRWRSEDASEPLLDIAVSRAPLQTSRLFSLTENQQLCTRPDTIKNPQPWLCTEAPTQSLRLDAAPISGGHVVVVVQPSGLAATRFVDDTWQTPVNIGEEGTYEVATVGSTAGGKPYVVALRTNKLRITVAGADGVSWSPWAPVFGGSMSGQLTALDSSRVPGQPEVLYAIVDGEVFTAGERLEATIDGWATNPNSPAEFEAWQRIESLPSLDL